MKHVLAAMLAAACLFVSNAYAQDDNALVTAVRQAGNVVLCEPLVAKEVPSGDAREGDGADHVIVKVVKPFTPLAESAAVAALTEGPDGIGWVAEHAALAIENRTRLANALRALGFVAAPPAGNFLFVPIAGAKAIAEGMARRGVLVRALTGLPQDVPALAAAGGEALRIGVGPWDAMERVLEAFAGAAACA